MKVSHKFVEDSAVFNENHIVSCAGLVPVMTLAEQTRLTDLLAEKISITATKIASGAANPAPKLVTLIAGMCAGADSIDDIDVLRSGGMKELFGNVYAPSTIGTLLREFTFGHNRQLESVLREHLISLASRTDILPGLVDHAFIDIDSLLRPVYGHAKEGASYGHAKIAGKKDSHRSQRYSAPPIPHRSSPGCGYEQAKPHRVKAQAGWSPKPSSPPEKRVRSARSSFVAILPTAPAPS